MLPKTADGRSGFQFCNLNELNGGKLNDKETFYKACRAASILGTLQAGYTDFKYLSPASKEITEKEALIGVSITGWMNNPEVLFDKETMKRGAEIVLETNKYVAKLIGINPAARGTCVKPSGNASVILGTASGIHGEHSEFYFRNVQMNADDEVAQLIGKVNPKMLENSVWSSNGTDVVVSFPIAPKAGSLYKNSLYGVKQLEYVKLAQQYWVEYGTDVQLCRDPKLRHNVSNTITVDNWDEVEEYLYNNRQWFAGVSLMGMSGDKDYPQAPFTEVIGSNKLLAKYGDAAIFASGLIVDALHAFNDDLWSATSQLQGRGKELSDESKDLLKRDWLRRANKFADKFLEGDVNRLTEVLKDCYNLHKWLSITNDIKPIDFAHSLKLGREVDADTIASEACAGGVCELKF